TPEQLRARSWWNGPELFVVIDDYDLLGTGGAGPLTPLLDMLPLGADIGLHLILARGAGGFSRAMGEPALRMLIDANTPSIVLSCPPSEGILFGSLRPRTLPPGRALRLDRRDPVQIQLAIAPETEEAAQAVRRCPAATQGAGDPAQGRGRGAARVPPRPGAASRGAKVQTGGDGAGRDTARAPPGCGVSRVGGQAGSDGRGRGGVGRPGRVRRLAGSGVK